MISFSLHSKNVFNNSSEGLVNNFVANLYYLWLCIFLKEYIFACGIHLCMQVCHNVCV